MANRYVFDLDNTLIYTDKLNNASYNYALQRCGLIPINSYSRVTRDIVFKCYPFLNEFQKKEIVKVKQSYFIKNIDYTELNTVLLAELKSRGADYSILWTSSNKERCFALLSYYNIGDCFKEIVFSNKDNIEKDIEKICNIFICNSMDLIFYENDASVIKKLKFLGQKVNG